VGRGGGGTRGLSETALGGVVLFIRSEAEENIKIFLEQVLRSADFCTNKMFFLFRCVIVDFLLMLVADF
jgi:hypothetical protein